MKIGKKKKKYTNISKEDFVFLILYIVWSIQYRKDIRLLCSLSARNAFEDGPNGLSRARRRCARRPTMQLREKQQ